MDNFRAKHEGSPPKILFEVYERNLFHDLRSLKIV